MQCSLRLALLSAITAIASPAVAQAQDVGGSGWIQNRLTDLDALFGDTTALLETFLFADLGTGLPLIVAILLLGGIYYSFYFGWLSFRGFGHAIDVIRGRYDHPEDPGEITHFQALTQRPVGHRRSRKYCRRRHRR